MKYIFLTFLTFSTHAFSCDRCINWIYEDYRFVYDEFTTYMDKIDDRKIEEFLYLSGRMDAYIEVMRHLYDCEVDSYDHIILPAQQD